MQLYHRLVRRRHQLDIDLVHFHEIFKQSDLQAVELFRGITMKMILAVKLRVSLIAGFGLALVLVALFVAVSVLHAGERYVDVLGTALGGAGWDKERIGALECLQRVANCASLFIAAGRVLETDHVHCRNFELDHELIICHNHIEQAATVAMRVVLAMTRLARRDVVNRV